MSLRRAVAYHEAGHCAVAWALGYQCFFAWVKDDSGYMEHAAPRDERHAAIILIAGGVAQWRVAPASPQGVSDAQRIAALDPRLAACCWAEAEMLVARHWGLIEDVAARLMESGEVSGIEVTQVCLGLKAQWCS
jgi:hypothetical protein